VTINIWRENICCGNQRIEEAESLKEIWREKRNMAKSKVMANENISALGVN